MTGNKEWYAVYTKPRWEKKVFEWLTARGITAYCPLNKVVKQWSDRKKAVEVPLFTSYVFVQISEAAQLQVRMTPGVVNFVYWLGKIARIRETEMADLQAFVNSHSNIRIEEIIYNKGDIFEIESGVLKGQKAEVKAIRKNKLELVLKSMNMRLVIDHDNVQGNT